METVLPVRSGDVIIILCECFSAVFCVCVCFNRPEQHGAELLSPLSNILETATDAQGAAPSALALEGLYYLCEAEVRALA